jgi:hypothetical protein
MVIIGKVGDVTSQDVLGNALLLFGPDGNKWMPWVRMIANFRCKCTQDFLRQLAAAAPAQKMEFGNDRAATIGQRA